MRKCLKCDDMQIFPIGTSRIHEPLSLIKDKVNFPGVGYFHSTSQVINWLEILTSQRTISLEESCFFFRKDQTPDNPFNLSLWQENYEGCIENAKKYFNESEVLIIEISTEKSWFLNGLAVQGNPNKFHNVSYSDAWNSGYYNIHHPELRESISTIDDNSKLTENIIKIANLILKLKKGIIFLGYIFDPNKPNQYRFELNDLLKNTVYMLNNDNFVFYDQSYLVKDYGFRKLENGSIDIHHLPWECFAIQINDFLKIIDSFAELRLQSCSDKVGLKTLYLSLGENCLPDNILQRHRLKSFSTPFSACRSNIDYGNYLENTNYSAIVNSLSLAYDYSWGRKVVRSTIINQCDDIYDVNHCQGFEFTHHDVISNSNHRDSYIRKVNRLYDRRSDSNFVFFYFHRRNLRSRIDSIISKLGDFRGHYASRNSFCLVVLFYQVVVSNVSDRKLVKKVHNNNVFEYVFFTEKEWAGDDPEVFWARVDDDLIKEMFDDLNIWIKKSEAVLQTQKQGVDNLKHQLECPNNVIVDSERIISPLRKEKDFLNSQCLIGFSSRANHLERSGKYSEALEAYRNLRSTTGLSAWDWNIRSLELRLGADRTVFFRKELGSILRECAGIERIYVANLKHRIDRKRRIVTEFSNFGINLADVEIVDAVNGATNPRALELFEHFKTADSSQYDSTRTVPQQVIEHDRSHSSLGVIGYLLTQELIFKDALSKGYKKILVLDDDVFFSPQACELVYRFFKPGLDWRVVHLGSSEHTPFESEDLQRKFSQAAITGYYNPIPYGTCGSFAVAYDQSVLKKLLQLVTEYMGVFDRSILSYFYTNISDQCFTLRPAVCCADVTDSDIRESRDMIQHGLRMGWDVSRYEEYRSSYE